MGRWERSPLIGGRSDSDLPRPSCPGVRDVQRRNADSDRLRLTKHLTEEESDEATTLPRLPFDRSALRGCHYRATSMSALPLDVHRQSGWFITGLALNCWRTAQITHTPTAPHLKLSPAIIGNVPVIILATQRRFLAFLVGVRPVLEVTKPKPTAGSGELRDSTLRLGYLSERFL